MLELRGLQFQYADSADSIDLAKMLGINMTMEIIIHEEDMFMDLTTRRAVEAFGDKTRYEILSLLEREGGLSVNEISLKIGKHRTTIDKHLRILLDAGFVTRNYDEKRGVYIYMLTQGAKEVLNEFNKALKSEGKLRAEMVIPIKRYTALRYLRRVSGKLSYIPAFVFMAIGFIGFFSPVKVGLIYRAIWLLVFMILTWLWVRLVKELTRALLRRG